MKIEWKKAGGAYVTIGDDGATTRKTIEITAWGGSALMQTEPLFRAANPFNQPRGNVSGTFAFGVTCSHATLDAAAQAFYDEYARIGEKGDLKITTTAKVITYSGATLNSVQRGGKEGVRLQVVYAFTIGAGTIG